MFFSLKKYKFKYLGQVEVLLLYKLLSWYSSCSSDILSLEMWKIFQSEQLVYHVYFNIKYIRTVGILF